MNDRFKFRVWDKEIKKFRYNDVALDCNGKPFVITCDPENPVKYLDNVEVNFCTGLKDRNGKDIYAGDILNVNTGSRDTSGIGEVMYLQCGCNFVLNGFLENPSGYYPRRKGEFHRNLQEWLCTEIIGNIYTTPELLEGKNEYI